MLRLIGFLVALAVWSGVLRRWRRRVEPPLIGPAPLRDPRDPVPLVSIILPARDEAAGIEACVRSLLAQDYPRFEVIAINDRSKDATGTILDRLAAEDPRLTVVRGEALPPGWMGKAHAVLQGYRVARGEWLLFTDADTDHAPWLLSSVMARLVSGPASFATVLAHQHHPGPLVYLVNLAVFVGVYLHFDARAFEDPASPFSRVNGQFVIFSREAYESIGTHGAVREFSSTDVSIGYVAKLQGWIPLVLDGSQGLRTTMYRDARSAFEGWARSRVNGAWTAAGRRAGSVALVLHATMTAAFWIGPWVLLRRSIAAGDAVAVVLWALTIAAGIVLIHLHRRRRNPWSTLMATLAMPVSTTIQCAAIAAGLAQAIWRRGTIWKGRLVRTARRLPPWHPQPPKPR